MDMDMDKATRSISLDVGDVPITPLEMARGLTVTFFPQSKMKPSSDRLNDFAEKLKKVLIHHGVKVVDYNDTLIPLPLKKKTKWFFRKLVGRLKSKEFKLKLGKKVRPGVAIIAVGEGDDGNLPMDNTMSFKENPVITVVEYPKNINKNSTYTEHIHTALNLFSWHMTNLIIAVSDKEWLIYSFNGSHPSYSLEDNFEEKVLNSLIPKISAPVLPPTLAEFEVRNNLFDPENKVLQPFIDDLLNGSRLFESTNLFPKGMLVDDLKFRNSFYRWIGKIHLDKRSGMSFGFLARQLPVIYDEPIVLSDTFDFSAYTKKSVNVYEKSGNLYLLLQIKGERLFQKVPEVWVLTSRSGADKTNLDKSKDLVKMGLVNGKKILDLPRSYKEFSGYRPSYDTKVILTHALVNAIFASIIEHFNPSAKFSKMIKEDGYALVHWHGYINNKLKPQEMFEYGSENPSVSCSSPQSAIYAFRGKENMFTNLVHLEKDYFGDIHVEPQHGVNVSFPTIISLAEKILNTQDMTSLGENFF